MMMYIGVCMHVSQIDGLGHTTFLDLLSRPCWKINSVVMQVECYNHITPFLPSVAPFDVSMAHISDWSRLVLFAYGHVD